MGFTRLESYFVRARRRLSTRRSKIVEALPNTEPETVKPLPESKSQTVRVPSATDDTESEALRWNECSICLDRDVPNGILCQGCHAWNDARHALHCWKPDRENLTYRPLDDITKAGLTCAICREIGRAVNEFEAHQRGSTPGPIRIGNGGPYLEPDTNPFKIDNSRLVEYKEDSPRFRTVVYVAIRYGSNSQASTGTMFSNSFGLQLDLNYTDNGRRLGTVHRWETPRYDPSQMRRWLDDCGSNHTYKECKEPDPHARSSPLPSGFRVIDVERRCVIQAPLLSYAALSYTWPAPGGPTDLDTKLSIANLNHLSHDGRLEDRILPGVIVDAMDLCRQMKQRYLWVDRLCIIQDDDVDKKNQIHAMDAVYSNASFTIVNAPSNDKISHLTGSTAHPRGTSLLRQDRIWDADKDVREVQYSFDRALSNSVWATRGWTFQEGLLARRLFFFCDHEVFYVCWRDHAQRVYGDKLNGAAYGTSYYRAEGGDEQLSRLLENYTSRNLRYYSDVLDAFTGVSNALCYEADPVSAIPGPFLLGHREGYFCSSLLWGHTGHVARRPDVSLPSWSWASWMGKVSYAKTTYGGQEVGYGRMTGTIAQFHYVEANHSLRPIQEMTWWFERDPLDRPLITNGVVPYMEYLPNQDHLATVWKKCPQNPWSLQHHLHLDPSAVKIAHSLPNALVFNSTIASCGLGKPKLTRSDKTGAELYSVDIIDRQGTTIGSLMDINKEYIDSELASRPICEFVVICAGIRSHRQASMYLRRVISAEKLEGFNPWVLHVMLVECNSVGSCVIRRIALGIIEMGSWADMSPRWQTFVLS